MRARAFLIGYAILINVFSCALMFADKRRAKRLAYRIPEATLFLVAVIGGSVGAILGMYLFHHKTKHRLFTIGLPVLLVLQILLILWIRARVQILLL